MKSHLNRGWIIGGIVWILIIACNIPMAAAPGGSEPTLSLQDMAATAVELTLAARPGDVFTNTPLPPLPELTLTSTSTLTPGATVTSTFTGTPCVPTTTANSVDVNVRSGPSTAYDIVGALPSGNSARVYGQNNARTWWYIEFPGSSGRYAWVSGSVTTASCIPDNLQYVAAPPLPTATNTLVVSLLPDLYISEYSWAPVPPHMGIPFHIHVGVYNQGNAPAGAFTVQWWLSNGAPAPGCTWHKANLVAHGGYLLQCNYTSGGWNNAYPSLVVVDSGNTVAESNEANNRLSQPLKVAP